MDQQHLLGDEPIDPGKDLFCAVYKEPFQGNTAVEASREFIVL